ARRRHGPRGSRRRSSSSWRGRSPASRRGSRVSGAMSTMTGRRWTSSGHTEQRVTSSSCSSIGGRSRSARRRPRDMTPGRRRTEGVHAVTIAARRALDSTTPSFATLAEDLLDDVYGYLLYVTKNWAVAEDLTGETFEAA